MAVVEIRDLSKSYGKVRALRGVSFDIGDGVTGLLGPNGAGKSTLLLCVLGLLDGWHGEVSVLGLDARAQGREVRRRVGFMPEADCYLPEMSGIQAVRHLGRLGGLPRAEALRRAHEVLWHVGLGEAVYREIREYSIGMRQRFKLAQALVHDPEVLFLDEPLGGLDPVGRDELLDLVRDLAKGHGKHVIWSSHILPEVQKVADQVVILELGLYRGTAELGEPSELSVSWRVEVEGDDRVFQQRLATQGARIESGGQEAGAALWGRRSLKIELDGHDVPRQVYAAAIDSGVRVRRLSRERESLETVFHRLLNDQDEDR